MNRYTMGVLLMVDGILAIRERVALISYLAAVFWGTALFAESFFLGAVFLAGTSTRMSLIPKSVINWDAFFGERVTWRLCSINRALILL